MFEADAWRIWWWGPVVSLAHWFSCGLPAPRKHRSFLWSEPSSTLTRSPTILCLLFLSTFVSSGSAFLVYIRIYLYIYRYVYMFFLVPPPVSPGAASSLPQALVASSTLRCDYTATGVWGGCLHKGTGVLALGFLLRSWTASKPVLLALQFKLGIFLLFLSYICFTVNT